jgi:cytidylate kinase
MKLHKVTEEKAAKMITDSDKKRTQYNQIFAGDDWNDARNYDLSIDVSRFGLDGSVKILLNFLQSIMETK